MSIEQLNKKVPFEMNVSTGIVKTRFWCGWSVFALSVCFLQTLQGADADDLKWEVESESTSGPVADPCEDFGAHVPVPIDQYELVAPFRMCFTRLLVDLNGDSKKDVLLTSPWWSSSRRSQFYSVYVSDKLHFRQSDGAISLGESNYSGQLPGSVGPVLLTCIRNSANSGGLIAYRVTDSRIERGVLDGKMDLSEDSAAVRELEAKYSPVSAERIPIALMETVHLFQEDLDDYIAKREETIYADPQEDYCARHSKPFGKPSLEGRELLRMDVDLNGDAKADVLLFTSTTLKSYDNYYWESYVMGDGGFRWQRDTLLLQPECRVEDEKMLGHYTAGGGESVLVRLGMVNGRLAFLDNRRIPLPQTEESPGKLPPDNMLTKAKRTSFPAS